MRATFKALNERENIQLKSYTSDLKLVTRCYAYKIDAAKINDQLDFSDLKISPQIASNSRYKKILFDKLQLACMAYSLARPP